jgi:hypothetical protein
LVLGILARNCSGDADTRQFVDRPSVTDSSQNTSSEVQGETSLIVSHLLKCKFKFD